VLLDGDGGGAGTVLELRDGREIPVLYDIVMVIVDCIEL